MNIQPLCEADFDEEASKAFGALVKHLRFGRMGSPWCAWAVQSIEHGTFLVCDLGELKVVGAFEEAISLVAESFVEHCMNTKTGLNRDSTGFDPSTSLTALIRNLLPFAEVDSILQQKRASLLRRGLMMGLLHPDSPFGPLTEGPTGRPFQTDYTFLNARWAVAQDEVFVSVNPELNELLSMWIKRSK